MAVNKASIDDFPNLVRLFKEFFPRHNVFNQKSPYIKKYLTSISQKYPLLIIKEKDPDTEEIFISAAAYIVKIDESKDKTHTRWKFRHFAFRNENSGEEMLVACEEYVKKQSNTIKIELTISESESSLHFFEGQSYQNEGLLKNHYRWGETCYVTSVESLKKN